MYRRDYQIRAFVDSRMASPSSRGLVRPRKRWRQRHSAEGSRWGPVDHELQVDAVVRETQKIDFCEFRLKFASEVRGILDSDAKRDYGAGIPQVRMPNTASGIESAPDTFDSLRRVKPNLCFT
jgi:hypothetical protein